MAGNDESEEGDGNEEDDESKMSMEDGDGYDEVAAHGCLNPTHDILDSTIRAPTT